MIHHWLTSSRKNLTFFWPKIWRLYFFCVAKKNMSVMQDPYSNLCSLKYKTLSLKAQMCHFVSGTTLRQKWSFSASSESFSMFSDAKFDASCSFFRLLWRKPRSRHFRPPLTLTYLSLTLFIRLYKKSWESVPSFAGELTYSTFLMRKRIPRTGNARGI